MRRVVSNSRGFTLVELLIVIVIIGILAGVVIGVLNPVQQQNRARDGTLRASLSKMALAAKSMSASSTNGNLPTGAEFFATVGGGVTAATGTANSCVDAIALGAGCSFTINGISLPTDCAAGVGTWNGTGAVACNARYFVSAAGATNTMRIYMKNFANPRNILLYEYQVTTATGAIVEGFYNCTLLTFTDNTTIAAGTCTRYNQ